MEDLVAANSTFSFTVDQNFHNKRIDIFLAHAFTSYSRSFFQRLIDSQCVLINGSLITKQGTSLKIGDAISVSFPKDPTPDAQTIIDKTINVTCVYEHKHFLILSKPAGLIVHKPKNSFSEPTLVDWVTMHFKNILDVGYVDRPGIVHRLDKDTSGLIIIARTNYAHGVFNTLFKNRTIKKTYLALVEKHPEKQGTIDLVIGRHPTHRNKMATFGSSVCQELRTKTTLRSAMTHFAVEEYFEQHSLVRAMPVTGRTHQIRVHLAALGHPIIGDIVYGRRTHLLQRQALHAYQLNFTFDNQEFSFTQELPNDMKELIQKLKITSGKDNFSE